MRIEFVPSIQYDSHLREGHWIGRIEDRLVDWSRGICSSDLSIWKERGRLTVYHTTGHDIDREPVFRRSLRGRAP